MWHAGGLTFICAINVVPLEAYQDQAAPEPAAAGVLEHPPHYSLTHSLRRD